MTQCKRCGTCCKKGGPSFHVQDKHLIEKGVILLKDIYTIRKGEPANDKVKMRIIYTDSDIIKIKNRKGTTQCIFFDESTNYCKIYTNRPVECSVLKCWDTNAIEQIYSKNRLTRKDLLYKVNGLWDLIDNHQKRCSYEAIRRLADTSGPDEKKAVNEVRNIISYDIHIRDLIVEKTDMNPEIIDFLSGRPLTTTIKGYGMEVKGI